jgi:hypothetical protein
VGRARFDAFLRSYFDHFAFQSITTADFLEYLRRELPTKVPLEEWIGKAGIPGGAAEPESDAFRQVEEEAGHWQQGAAIETNGWSTQLWLHFLRTLKEPDMGRLDREFHLTESGNSEILHQWLLMAVRSGYKAAYPRMEQFLTTVGRRKFVKPLYTELMKTPEGQERARRIYGQARAGYHPIAQATVDGIVGGKG